MKLFKGSDGRKEAKQAVFAAETLISHGEKIVPYEFHWSPEIIEALMGILDLAQRDSPSEPESQYEITHQRLFRSLENPVLNLSGNIKVDLDIKDLRYLFGYMIVWTVLGSDTEEDVDFWELDFWEPHFNDVRQILKNDAERAVG